MQVFPLKKRGGAKVKSREDFTGSRSARGCPVRLLKAVHDNPLKAPLSLRLPSPFVKEEYMHRRPACPAARNNRPPLDKGGLQGGLADRTLRIVTSKATSSEFSTHRGRNQKHGQALWRLRCCRQRKSERAAGRDLRLPGLQRCGQDYHHPDVMRSAHADQWQRQGRRL